MGARRRSIAALAALAGAASVALAGGAGAMAAAPTQPRQGAPSVAAATRTIDMSAVRTPTLRWRSCTGDERGARYQCASALVPLDYSRPDGPTMRIGLARRLASRSTLRTGAVFINPGGPGGSSIEAIGGFARVLGSKVTDRYDVVGIDPRGVGRSQALVCRSDRPWAELTQSTPLSEAQRAAQYRADDQLRAACKTTPNYVKYYMSTADTARDMELVRRALRQPSLNYHGVSYGTQLGQTYAALFPTKVRALVIDGNLDADAWVGRGSETARPSSARFGSGEGTWESVDWVLRECGKVGYRVCPGGTKTRAEYDYVRSRLRERALRVDGQVISESDFANLTVGLSYGDGWWDLASVTHELARLLRAREAAAATRAAPDGSTSGPDESAAAAAIDRAEQEAVDVTQPVPTPVLSPGRVTAARGGFAARYGMDASFQGVLCSEAANPTDRTAWFREGARLQVPTRTLHTVWTWASSPCAGWPAKAKNAYRGSFASAPRGGALVMNNRYDGPTPYRGALRAHELIGGSRLVTTMYAGHGTLDVSSCASWHRTRYIVDGRLPSRDITCAATKKLFSRTPS